MNLKNRLAKIENKREAAKPNLIFVHLKGDAFGICNGQRLSFAEWDSIKGDNCEVIYVTNGEGENGNEY